MWFKLKRYYAFLKVTLEFLNKLSTKWSGEMARSTEMAQGVMGIFVTFYQGRKYQLPLCSKAFFGYVLIGLLCLSCTLINSCSDTVSPMWCIWNVASALNHLRAICLNAFMWAQGCHKTIPFTSSSVGEETCWYVQNAEKETTPE